MQDIVDSISLLKWDVHTMKYMKGSSNDIGKPRMTKKNIRNPSSQYSTNIHIDGTWQRTKEILRTVQETKDNNTLLMEN